MTRIPRILLGGAVAASLAALPMAVRAADADLKIEFPPADAADAPPTDFHFGETLTYTVVITNLGPSVAEGVQIKTFDVAAPLELVSVGGCTPVTAGTPVPCTVGNGEVVDDVAPATPTHQKTVTFDVKLHVDLDAKGNPIYPTTCPDGSGLAAVTVTVGLAATLPPAVVGDPAVPNPTVDPNPANNSVTSPVPVIGTFTDLGITLTAPATASIGGPLDVTATIINNGPCPATDVMSDDENGLTTLTLEFVSADGDCTEDPLNGTCEWASLAPTETKTWTIHYKVLDFPPTLMQSGEPVSLTVFRNPDAAPDPIDVNPDNDSATTQTVVKKHVGSCSTGGMGGALSLLVLAMPFLRRRRKG